MAYQLSPTEEELVNRLTRDVNEAKSAKGELETTWDRWTRYYNGDQWFELDPAPEPWVDDERITVNLVKQTVDTIIPIALDSVPTWYVRAYNSQEDQVAAQLQDYLQGLYYELNVPRAYKLALQDACVLGTGVLKVFPNSVRRRHASVVGTPQENIWPCVAYLNPRSVFPDPDSDNLEDCEFLALRNVMPEGLVLSHWGQQLAAQGADVAALQAENVSDRDGTWQYRLSSSRAEHPRRQVWEVYHDFGRTLTIFSNRTILYTGANPIPDFQFPVVPFSLSERGSDLWGLGVLFGGGDKLQQTTNQLFTRMKIHARIAGNPKWVKHGPGGEDFDTMPGGVVTFPTEGGNVAALNPPEFPAYAVPLMNLLLQSWESWTGVREVLQGRRPQGITAGIAIQQLQESAATRLRQLMRDWSIQFGEVGQRLLSLVTRYTVGQATTFSGGPRGVERASVNAQDMQQGDGTPKEFRVVVAPVSELPMGQAQIAQILMQLAPTLGPAATPIVLEALRIPGRERILAQLQQAALGQLQQAMRDEMEAKMQAASSQQDQQQMLTEQEEQLGQSSQGAI